VIYDLDGLKRMLDAGSSEGWGYNFGDDHEAQISTFAKGEMRVIARGLSRDDAELICAMRRELPRLLVLRDLLKGFLA